MKTRNLVSSPVSNYKVTHNELLPQCFSVLENQLLENSNLSKISANAKPFFMIKKKNVFFFGKTACVITDNNLTEVDVVDRLSEMLEKTCDALKVLSAQRYMENRPLSSSL